MLGYGGPAFVIEPFRAPDLVGALRLVKRSLGEELPFSFLLQMSELKPQYVKVARDPSTGELVGLIVGTKEAGHEGRVLVFAVDPAFQGLGAGHGLLGSLQQDMALEDVRQVSLEVRTDNERAIAFYTRHGFHVTGLEPGSYKDGSDAFRMMKPLR